MKKWAFVSDFDGTISKKDFYHLVMEKYFHEGASLFTKWKAGEMKDIEFLSTVFSSIHQNETQIIEDIHSLEIDEHVTAFIRKVQAQGGGFLYPQCWNGLLYPSHSSKIWNRGCESIFK